MSCQKLIVIAVHVSVVATVLKLVSYCFPLFTSSVVTLLGGVVSVVLFSSATLGFAKRNYLRDEVDKRNKAVLITGCDSGFGHLLARRLDSRGYRVFASCLHPSGEGATELRESSSDLLQVFHLDVRSEESVCKAEEYVKNNLRSSELWAVVNNAGIHKGFSVEFSHLDDFRDCMNVNAFGQLRVTKSFLPLLRKSKGRVINVTSNAGRFPIAHCTPYSMSKHAAAGANDCLRQEMAPLGVNVISVEPEMFQTPLSDKESIDKRFEWMLATADKDVLSQYDEKYLTHLRTMKDLFVEFAAPDVHLVIDDLESAISRKYPDPVYKPRRNAIVRLIMDAYEVMPSEGQDIIFNIISHIGSVVQYVRNNKHS